jgi:hypothetical protein
VRFELTAQTRFIKRVDSKAKVVQVPTLLCRSRATGFAQSAIDGNQIQDRSAGPKLNESNVVLAQLDRTPQSVAVKAKHLVKVDDAQNKMVDFAYSDHRDYRIDKRGRRIGPIGRTVPTIAKRRPARSGALGRPQMRYRVQAVAAWRFDGGYRSAQGQGLRWSRQRQQSKNWLRCPLIDERRAVGLG